MTLTRPDSSGQIERRDKQVPTDPQLYVTWLVPGQEVEPDLQSKLSIIVVVSTDHRCHHWRPIYQRKIATVMKGIEADVISCSARFGVGHCA